MKTVNFITPLPPRLEREVRVWNWLTIIGSSSLLLIISVHTSMQYSLYRSLSQERSSQERNIDSYNALLEQQRKQTEEQEQLQTTINQIIRYKTAPKNPLNALNTLGTVTGKGMQTITIAKNHFELQVACQHAQHTTICLQKLLDNPHIRSVKLISVQSNQKQVIAVFKGEIITY